jgi:hypothetical protein
MIRQDGMSVIFVAINLAWELASKIFHPHGFFKRIEIE